MQSIYIFVVFFRFTYLSIHRICSVSYPHTIENLNRYTLYTVHTQYIYTLDQNIQLIHTYASNANQVIIFVPTYTDVYIHMNMYMYLTSTYSFVYECIQIPFYKPPTVCAVIVVY